VGEDPSAADVAKEAIKAFSQLGDQFRSAFAKEFEDVQYRFDKELGKQLAKHPELYAEVKRGYRTVRKGMDKIASDLGIK
jgi:hypothetical protein